MNTKLNTLVEEMLKFNKRKKALNIMVIILIYLFCLFLPIIRSLIHNGTEEISIALQIISMVLSAAFSMLSFATAIVCIIFDFLSKKYSKSFVPLAITEIAASALLLIIMFIVQFYYEGIMPILVASLSLITLIIFFANFIIFRFAKDPVYKSILNEIDKVEGKDAKKKFQKNVNILMKKRKKTELVELFEKYSNEENNQNNQVTELEKRNGVDFMENKKQINVEDLIYKHDSESLQMLIDPNNNEDIELGGENGQRTKFSQVYVCQFDGKLYCILKPIDKVQNVADDEALVFSLEENESVGRHQFKLVTDDAIAEKVFDSYYAELDAANNENTENKNYNATKSKSTKKKKGKVHLIDALKNKFKKEDHGRVGTFITLTVTYVIFTALSLISYFTNFFGVFANAEEIIYCQSISLLVLAISQVYFVYFGFHNPFKFHTAVKWIFIVLGVLLMGGIDYFAIDGIIKNMSNIEGLFILSIPATIIIQIGYLVGFGYWCKDLPSTMNIVVAFVFPVLSILIVAVFLIYEIIRGIIWFIFEGLIPMFAQLFGGTEFGQSFKAGFNGGKIPSSTDYTYEINEDGHDRKLEYYDHYNGHDRYKDDTGRYWYTDDDGTTFYKE